MTLSPHITGQHRVPLPLRVVKHAIFSILPGETGLRNRACFHHLVKRPTDAAFDVALGSIKAGDVCIDCGANKGDFTVKFLNRGATTYAFEPDPWTFDYLNKRLGDQTSAITINKAVSTAPGTVAFFRDEGFENAPQHMSVASTMFRRHDRAQTQIDVEAIDFLAFIESLDKDIRVLKMDIEGAEVDILELLFASPLMNRIDYLFVETHELQFPELLRRTWDLRRQAPKFDHTVVNMDWH